MVVLGRLGSPYGVRGWLRVHAATRQPEGLLSYTRLRVRKGGRQEVMELEQGQRHGKGVVVKFAELTSREAAGLWTGATVGVARDQLPALPSGEFYWHDLLGLRVVGARGEMLGEVSSLLETGAHDVLVVKGEREILIPYVMGEVVREVDLARGIMVVSWDPEY